MTTYSNIKDITIHVFIYITFLSFTCRNIIDFLYPNIQSSIFNTTVSYQSYTCISYHMTFLYSFYHPFLGIWITFTILHIIITHGSMNFLIKKNYTCNNHADDTMITLAYHDHISYFFYTDIWYHAIPVMYNSFLQSNIFTYMLSI